MKPISILVRKEFHFEVFPSCLNRAGDHFLRRISCLLVDQEISICSHNHVVAVTSKYDNAGCVKRPFTTFVVPEKNSSGNGFEIGKHGRDVEGLHEFCNL